MDVNVYLFIVIMIAHWFADFVMQTDKMALNKSTSLTWLTSHVITYTGWLMLTSAIVMRQDWRCAVAFAATNGICHFMTDFFTSRWTSALWKAERRHAFFVVIGLDQLLHMIVLFVTFAYLIDIARGVTYC